MSIETIARPLGIIQEAPLTPEQEKSFAVLEKYDLTPVRTRLIQKQIVPEDIVDSSIMEFRKYMGLYLVQKDSVTMFSQPVDEVWHNTILHTRLYTDFCQSVFGYYLHHDPFEGGDPNPSESWRRFEWYYNRLYGQLNPLWLN